MDSSQVKPGMSSSSTALITSGATPIPTRNVIWTEPVPGGSGPESTNAPGDPAPSVAALQWFATWGLNSVTLLTG